MNTNYSTKRGWVGILSLLLFALVGCSPSVSTIQEEEPEEKAKELPPLDLLRSGDLILRLGHGSSSEYFRQHASRNQEFSHCGILYLHRGEWFVLHAELASFRGMDGPVIEPLESFVDHSIRWAVYRNSLDEEERRSFCKNALQCVKQKRTFDCSEYVAFCFNRVLPAVDCIKPTFEIANTGKMLFLLDDLVAGLPEIARGEGTPQ